MARLAFYTFGVLHDRETHPEVREFGESKGSVFSEARRSEGFIDLDDGSWGEYARPKFFDSGKHKEGPATLSLWTDIESVFAFAYRNEHGDVLKKRSAWFIKAEWPIYVAWWVSSDHIPNREEACTRLEHLHDNGSTPYAFNFKKPFDENGLPVEIDKNLLQSRIESNKKIG